MNDNRTLTVTEAANRLSVRVDEIYRLIRSKRLDAEKVDGKLRISMPSFIRHVESRKRNGG